MEPITTNTVGRARERRIWTCWPAGPERRSVVVDPAARHGLCPQAQGFGIPGDKFVMIFVVGEAGVLHSWDVVEHEAVAPGGDVLAFPLLR